MRHVRPLPGFLFAISLLPMATGAAVIDSDELARCAGIAPREARLACYDALAHRTPDAVPATAGAAPSGPRASAAAVPTIGAAAPAAPADAGAVDPNSFGLSAVQRHVAVVGPAQESARIVSLAANQTGHAIIVLDSGQTWSVLDNDGFLSSNDQVTIKRAALGSYLMSTPSHHIYRVHRDK